MIEAVFTTVSGSDSCTLCAHLLKAWLRFPSLMEPTLGALGLLVCNLGFSQVSQISGGEGLRSQHWHFASQKPCFFCSALPHIPAFISTLFLLQCEGNIRFLRWSRKSNSDSKLLLRIQAKYLHGDSVICMLVGACTGLSQSKHKWNILMSMHCETKLKLMKSLSLFLAFIFWPNYDICCIMRSLDSHLSSPKWRCYSTLQLQVLNVAVKLLSVTFLSGNLSWPSKSLISSEQNSVLPGGGPGQRNPTLIVYNT